MKTQIPRSLASAIPDPILYEHGQVGECNDLIFGFSLVDYATAKGLSEGDVPKILRRCVEEIDKRGLESEGIYRVRFVMSFPYLLTKFFRSPDVMLWFNLWATQFYQIVMFADAFPLAST